MKKISLQFKEKWILFEHFKDKKYILITEFKVISDRISKAFTISLGFITDFRTGPVWLDKILIQKSIAFVIHDWLYQNQICTRKEADIEQDYWLQQDPNFTWLERKVIYIGVRLFGEHYWRYYKRIKLEQT